MSRRNVGGLDRAARLVSGGVLLPVGLFLLGATTWGVVATLLGVAALATGITGFCPPYVLFGFSTARSRRARTSDRNDAGIPSEGR